MIFLQAKLVTLFCWITSILTLTGNQFKLSKKTNEAATWHRAYSFRFGSEFALRPSLGVINSLFVSDWRETCIHITSLKMVSIWNMHTSWKEYEIVIFKQMQKITQCSNVKAKTSLFCPLNGNEHRHIYIPHISAASWLFFHQNSRSFSKQLWSMTVHINIC